MAKVRFQLDEHIPQAVAQALRLREIDVAMPADSGLRGSPDEQYLLHSRVSGRVLVTQDRDFLRIQSSYDHAGIAYCQQGARSIGQIIAGLVLMYDMLDSDEMLGSVRFL